MRTGVDRRAMGFLAFLLLLAGGCGNGEKELAEARKFGASAYNYYVKASEWGNVRATLRLAYECQSAAPILFKPADRVELGKDRTAEMVQLLWRAGTQDFERTLQFLSAFKAFKWMEGAAMVRRWRLR